MKNPLASIIICTYNRSELLFKTLESVFTQKYVPVEIIIIDDGSTDDTELMVKSFGNKVIYYKKNHEGIAKSRSFGCRVAKGEFIAFQDDDDLMHEDKICLLYEALRLYPSAIFATGDFVIIDEKGNLTNHRWLPESENSSQEAKIFENGYEAVMWPKVPTAPHTTLFKRSYGEKIGWFDDEYIISEDKDFFARLGRLGPVVYLPKVVSYYRKGHDSLTHNTILTSYRKLQLFQRHLNYFDTIDPKMKKRLKARLMIELKAICRFVNDGNVLPEMISKEYSKIFLSNLNACDRIKYYGYRYLKLPLRRMKNIISR